MSSVQTSRIPSLDGLRALSIALVVLGHLTGTRNFPQHIHFIGSYANFGVRVFFVISGYLITSLLLKERLKRGRIDLLEFYRRRAYRILPPAYLYMLLICIADWSHLTGKNVVTAFTYTSNYFMASTPWRLGHLWSLSIEEQFYLLWPAALVLAFARGRQIALGVVLLAPVLRIVFYFAGAQYVEYYFPTVADAIATGCLLAIVWPELKRFDRILLSRFMILAPIVTLAIPLLRGSGWENRIYQTVGVSVMHFGIAVCIYNAICRSWRWLNYPIMIWIGLTSYSLYLWQQLFLDRADQVHWWTAFPQNLALAVAAAACSYYFVERPFLRLRDVRREISIPATASAVSGIAQGS
jgi:peptidoglycan/LPS O-acetylase OafA/YrhL